LLFYFKYRTLSVKSPLTTIQQYLHGNPGSTQFYVTGTVSALLVE